MMVKASKHKKIDRIRKDVCSRDDRIGGLPDAILCNILSYLPTKEAARTSILSKQWNGVWTSVSCIEIDDCLLGSNWASRYYSVKKNCFMDFVDKVLRLNDVPCLRKLCLRFSTLYPVSRVREFINAAIMRDVEELDVALLTLQEPDPKCVGEGEHIELPPRLFTSQKLVILKLTDWCNILLNVPTAVYLPRLKILHLHLIQFFDDDSMKNLLDGCPVIEELDIENTNYKKVETLFVGSSSLKSLRVHTHSFCFYDDELTIVVDATNLERLDIKYDVPVEYDMVNLSSLVEVKLDLCESCPAEIAPDISGDNSLELLRILSNIEHLFLSCQIVQCLEYAHWVDLPMFHRLKHLELKTINYSWSVFSVLLECSPNLRTFVLHKERSRQKQLQFQAPKCFMLYLEEIELKGFKGCPNEMEMVRYFLKNATVLKKMSIQSYYSGSKRQSEISKKLLTFARGSTECQIIFG